MLSTVVLLQLLKYFKLIEFEGFSVENANRVTLISFLYSVNVGVALTALTDLRVPVYGALKRLTILATLIGEYIVLHKRPNSQINLSICVIVLGVLLMGAGDLEFNLWAYLAAFFSCTTQAAFLLILKKTSIEKKF